MTPLLVLLSSLAFSGEHARHAARPPLLVGPGPVAPPSELPEATPGPDAVVYGYQAYWAADLYAVPWDRLSHLALFAAETDAQGNLSRTDRWDDAPLAVQIGAAYGVRVHLTVILFDDDTLDALLGSATARGRLVDALAAEVEARGAHGVNVDFEGVPSGRRAELVEFVRALSARVPEVVLASPAVDWSGAWDYAALTEHASLFVMGYGYHWSGSSQPGPVDPLHGGGPWNKYALDWTSDDYLAKGADPDRVILGLPLYGYRWSASGADVPSDSLGNATSVVWTKAAGEVATHGRRFDESSRTPWYWDGAAQTWYCDTESVRERIQYALGAGLGGVGFWALHYDGGDAALWEMVDEETVIPRPDEGDPSDYVARAGRPFYAYVGDTVVLNGENSTGPEGVELQYRWTQVAGPQLFLDDARAPQPRFTVQEPYSVVFELRVGDGEIWSEPARSHVIVLDPGAGRRHAGGCASVPGLTPWLALLALGAVRRRR